MRISDWSSDVCSSDLARCDLRDLRGGDKALPPSVSSFAVRCDAGSPLAHRRIGDLTVLDVPDVRAMPRAVRSQIGNAPCRERVCQYGTITVVAVSLKKTSVALPIEQVTNTTKI